MKKPGIAILFLFFLVFCVCPWLHGGEKSSPLRPNRRPLAVARMPDAEIVARLLETRPARVLGLDDWDFSGVVPGLGAELTSLRAFLAGLQERDAENIWFSLGGASVVSPVAAFGCDWSEEKSQDGLGAWLDAFFPGHAFALDQDILSRKRLRWSMAANPSALTEAIGGKGHSSEGWRADLDAFMTEDSASLDFWLNPRPLLGLASLATSVDLRTKAADWGMQPPVSATLHLFPDHEDLGFGLRLASLFKEEWPEAEHLPHFLENQKPSLVRIQVPAPLLVLEYLYQGDLPFFLANINIHDLFPGLLVFDLWRDPDDDSLHWTVLSHIADRDLFAKQFARINAWVHVLSQSAEVRVAMTQETAEQGELTRYRVEGFSCVAGIIEAEDGHSYLVLGDSEAYFPEPADVELFEMGERYAARWRIDFDLTAATMVAERGAALLHERGNNRFGAETIRALIRQGDDGSLVVEGDSLVVSSERGATPLAFLGLGALLGDQLREWGF